jgi:two-component system LytT family response regulator
VRSFPEIFAEEAPESVRLQVAPIRVLVAEPDAVSRKLICSIVDDEPEMSIDCVDGLQLVSSIQESAPHLVIVDAHTPSIKRVGSWQAVGIKSPPATIVTAYDSAALTRFASIAVALLVKPFDVERFEAALDLAKSRIRRYRADSEGDNWSPQPQHPAFSPQFLQRLAVEAGEDIVLVRVEDIQWIQSANKHVQLHVGNRSHFLRRSMTSLLSMLDPNRFLRVHRNVIVNLDQVNEFHLPQDGNMFVKLNNGVILPLRKGNRAMIRKLLQNKL